MKKILESLADLIKVKTIVTLVVITVFAVLALTGAISADNVMIIISMVVSFYFGTQHEKKTTSENNAPLPDMVTNTVPDAQMYDEDSPVDSSTYSETHPDPTA